MTTSSTPTEVVRISGPQGIIGSIPYLLGFHPTQSLVMLCLYGARNRLGPVLRIDLPADVTSERRRLAEYLAIQADQHADSVVLICYSEESDTAIKGRRAFAYSALIKQCIKQIQGAGIQVFDAALVRNDSCVSYLQHSPGELGFPLVDESVDPDLARLGSNRAGSGRAVLADRQALRGSVAGPKGKDQTSMCRSIKAAQDALRGKHRKLEVFVEFCADLQSAHECAGHGLAFGNRAAALIAAMDSSDLRDYAIMWSFGHLDDALVPMFIALATATPDTYCAQVCAVLAVVAYRQGDGALAQVALDRVLAVDPSHRLAGLLMAMMQAGMPPHQLDSILGCGADEDEESEWNPGFGDDLFGDEILGDDFLGHQLLGAGLDGMADTDEVYDNDDHTEDDEQL